MLCMCSVKELENVAYLTIIIDEKVYIGITGFPYVRMLGY